MPEYHYRFICTTCGEKLVWEGDDHSDDFYIEPCQTCLQSAAQQMHAADTSPLCPECEIELHLTTAGEHVCRNEVCGLYR